MEDQTVEPKVKEESGDVLGLVMLAFVIAGLLALAGTILGAINFVSPTRYPAWILAIWLMVNILLLLFLLAQMGIYAIYVYRETEGDSDAQASLVGVTGFLSLVILVGSWILLTGRHFGWFSGLTLGIVCVMAFLDFFLWAHEESKKVVKG